jgi:hypothetical protein
MFGVPSMIYEPLKQGRVLQEKYVQEHTLIQTNYLSILDIFKERWHIGMPMLVNTIWRATFLVAYYVTI